MASKLSAEDHKLSTAAWLRVSAAPRRARMAVKSVVAHPMVLCELCRTSTSPVDRRWAAEGMSAADNVRLAQTLVWQQAMLWPAKVAVERSDHTTVGTCVRTGEVCIQGSMGFACWAQGGPRRA